MGGKMYIVLPPVDREWAEEGFWISICHTYAASGMEVCRLYSTRDPVMANVYCLATGG